VAEFWLLLLLELELVVEFWEELGFWTWLLNSLITN
jgi:hypothetical protein